MMPDLSTDQRATTTADLLGSATRVDHLPKQESLQATWAKAQDHLVALLQLKDNWDGAARPTFAPI